MAQRVRTLLCEPSELARCGDGQEAHWGLLGTVAYFQVQGETSSQE